MARRRFFVSEIRRGTARIEGADAEHLVRVLRAEVGESYELSDNHHLYLARIVSARKSLVEFELTEQLDAPPSRFHLTLVPALFKFDRFELMVEKATELGVNEILPFEATRTERGLLLAAAKRRLRWERIALEASQQSRRLHLPVVAESVCFENVIASNASVRLFLDEDPAAAPLLRVLSGTPAQADHFVLLTGPEGGWTDAERQRVIEQGWSPCSLGHTILRAETAAIAALSVVAAFLAAR